MKKLILFLYLCSWAAQAQITTYNNATQNAFYGIGGYSFSQGFFQGGVRPNPDVVSGPSPQNDFSYTVSSTGGLQHVYTYISTLSVNKSITLQFNGNNIRKFGCKATAVNIPTGQATTEPIFFVATTNLGNIANQTTALTEFVGFNVSGNENEYIVSVVASFVNPSTNSIAINNIIIGDNTPQNVALNFDGVNDYVSIPSTVGNFSTNQDFTVSCWIKPDASQTNGTENDIISKWDGNGNYPFVIRYFNQTNSSKGQVFAGQWDGANFSYGFSGVTIDDGQWHHVALTKSGTTFKLYTDGILRTTFTDVSTGTTNNTTPLYFGRRGDGSSHFKGEIDEVRIWTVAKTATEIADERFCKTPNSTNLQAAYNFSEGVPHGNNSFLSQVNSLVNNTTSAGTLNNFAKTGDASNFVTGQVKYVKANATGNNNGSSWTSAFTSLHSALVANTCNDLFDVYVFRFTYRPHVSDFIVSFDIPSGMRMYGGFDGTEKSINQRNMALIHSTNRTTLSADTNADDTPFNFTVNRADNVINVVNLEGNNTVFDGFTVRGCKLYSGGAVGIVDGGLVDYGTNSTIKNSRIIDNEPAALRLLGNSTTVANCYVLGNNNVGINSKTFSVNLNNNLIANNFGDGVFMTSSSGVQQVSITNCTIAANQSIGVFIINNGATLNSKIINTIIYANASAGIDIQGSGTTTTNITNSLIQGQTSTTNGNLNGDATDPRFVSPLANNVRSDAGDYRLKWCSKAIGAGSNTGISPLDLDRNPRNFNGTADMGAYEFLGNTPSQVNNSTITGTIDMPIYAGGAIQTITSTSKILAPAGAIDFKAPNSITLNPGFEARGVSSYFKAAIGPNVACSN